ncbi:hypothetical protein [Paratractidigestivibacter sp.]|uniref:hypothetical protein n=1 Tax=Paratractidigestivibacter sp. TaxID=2847316 RepID=UPI002ABD33DE|nr:hypothetical protein [Paratractidigestivibacter sp.]
MRYLIEDTRQKATQHATKHACWDAAGVTLVRHELEVGDYCRPPLVSVDTKKDMGEFCGNLRTDHTRFRAECERAQAMGTLLVVLVENDQGITSVDDLAKWREPTADFRRRRGKSRYYGSQIAKTCKTMTERYGVWFDFCAPDEAAQRVIDLLERGERWQRARTGR